jgi:hypothetical protein
MTQRDTVLGILQAAGSRGVHTFELRGQYIGNPSQRIAELEALGHRITHTRERLHGQATGTRYRLVSGGSVTAPVEGIGHAVVACPSESALFDVAEIVAPPSNYGQEAA